MYNVLKNSIKPNLPQRTTIALSRADQLTAAREYSSTAIRRNGGGVVYFELAWLEYK